MVWFDLDAGGDFNTIDPENLMLKWDPYNLTMNLEASVTISLWGYRVNIPKVVLSVFIHDFYILGINCCEERKSFFMFVGG